MMEQELIRAVQALTEELTAVRRDIDALLSSRKQAANRLLKQKEAASMLGCSSSLIGNMRRDGRIKAVPVGKTWRYPMSEVERVKTTMY